MTNESNNQFEYQKYFDKLVVLTRSLQRIRETNSFSDFISEIETNLDEITPFLFYKFYGINEDQKSLKIISELGPEELAIDFKMVQWSLSNDGPSLIPFQTPIDKNIKANILIPVVGAQTFGVISLWVDYETSGFNIYIALALKMLSQEIASTFSLINLTNKIKEQRDFMECIISSVPSGLFATKMDGTIVSINSNSEILFNVNRKEVIGKLFIEVFPEKISSTIHTLNLNAERTGGVAETELEYEFSEGNILYLGINSSIIYSESGEKIGYVIICRDLAISREVVKLRELDAMKNDFVSLVSHELRTPLSSIISYTELLLTPGMIESPEESNEFLNIIFQEGHRLARLINDILDLSKSESGKMDYIFAAQDINAIAKQSLRSSKPLAEKKNIELRLELDENLPEVSCDIDRIIQVYLNVLSNAIKFTPENGLIIIYSRLISYESKKYIQVEIKDNGCGIAEKDFDKVFNKFEQVENVESHSTGTGLGMPICKNIIEQGHGGRMFIKSELKKGTSMFFELPV